MTDREKAIKDLENIIATAEGIKGLSDDAGIIISLDKIDSLRFALDNLKTDASDKTDREQAITTLTEHLDHWKRLLSEGICTKDEGERTIKALTFAIESIDPMEKALSEILEQEPSVTPKSKTGYCKDCKYFEYNSVAKVDGIPLIVAHEICKKWGDGCKTNENGYCFLFASQESEVEE